jgi:hypothetical protein
VWTAEKETLCIYWGQKCSNTQNMKVATDARTIRVKALSRRTFLTISWIFLSFSWGWRAISRNRYDWEWVGWDEKDKRRTSYADPGRRWRVEAEAKPSANGRLFKSYFIHGTSPCTVAEDIYAVRFVSIPTSYIYTLQFSSRSRRLIRSPNWCEY